MRKHIIFDCDGTLVDTSSYKHRLFPGIKDLLIELSKNNLLYVWTARDRTSTLRILGDLGILSYFESLSTSDDAYPKPHVAGISQLVGSIDKQSICIIGDSSNDMLGAKNFGALGIGAIWNQAVLPQVLKDSGADFIVSHPLECSKLIELNLKGETHV